MSYRQTRNKETLLFLAERGKIVVLDTVFLLVSSSQVENHAIEQDGRCCRRTTAMMVKT